MSTKNFEYNLSTYSNDNFKDDELKVLKDCFRDAYSILKKYFDRRPRYKRPFNSVEAYKMHKDALLRTPCDYFRFQDENVLILLDHKPRGCFLTVAVTGTKFLKFDDRKIINEYAGFSGGFDFYGHFQLSEFTSAVQFWRECVENYILGKKIGVSFDDIEQQKKDAFRSFFHV